jgi:hypothetical protein
MPNAECRVATRQERSYENATLGSPCNFGVALEGGLRCALLKFSKHFSRVSSHSCESTFEAMSVECPQPSHISHSAMFPPPPVALAPRPSPPPPPSLNINLRTQMMLAAAAANDDDFNCFSLNSNVSRKRKRNDVD